LALLINSTNFPLGWQDRKRKGRVFGKGKGKEKERNNTEGCSLTNMRGGAGEEAGEELVSLLDDDIIMNDDDAVDGMGAGYQWFRGAQQGDANPTTLLMSTSTDREQQRRYRGAQQEQPRPHETLDWSHERAHGRAHHAHLRAATNRWPAPVKFIYLAMDRAQGWLLLCAVGVCSGIVCSLVDIGTDWATDLKLGRCGRGIWINRAVCCSDSSDLSSCVEWHTWGGQQAEAGGVAGMVCGRAPIHVFMPHQPLGFLFSSLLCRDVGVEVSASLCDGVGGGVAGGMNGAYSCSPMMASRELGKWAAMQTITTTTTKTKTTTTGS
jgi:hypothetical protein